jgi:hypothetical protein
MSALITHFRPRAAGITDSESNIRIRTRIHGCAKVLATAGGRTQEVRRIIDWADRR